MRAIHFLYFQTFVFLISACEPTPVINVVDKAKIGNINSVLILGNSIVKHGPSKNLGWDGDWGMAASSIDKDFVHLIISDIKRRDSSVSVKFENIAAFEMDYSTYGLSHLESFKNPDMLIIRISENVNGKEVEKNDFRKHYTNLIEYLDPEKKAVRVVVDGFWRNPEVNDIIKAYAVETQTPFITITDLSADPTNMASQFKHKGVAEHPSDKGMAMIKERIWVYIGQYFPKK